MADVHEWKTFKAGGVTQVSLACGADVEALAGLDPKRWGVLSMPLEGVRQDRRMLELLDTDGDGRIRLDEVLGAIDFLKAQGFDFDRLFTPAPDAAARLADIAAKVAALDRAEPSEEDLRATADWEAAGRDPAVAVLGEGTGAAEAAFAAVEGVVDAFFATPEDLPLVTEGPDVVLPLFERINPRHAEGIRILAETCVRPLLGERRELTRAEWGRVKAAFAPYRAWRAARPLTNAVARRRLEDEERLVRYELGLLELLENFVNLRRLYAQEGPAVFQTGVLRIDAKELTLCFHVADEAAHAALAGNSKCCLLYLKLTRPSEGATRQLCAAYTAGMIGGLYVGRNAVFVDRDGKVWEAVVTRLVENQVSLLEAFWAPWRKLGEAVRSAVEKFLGSRQEAAVARLQDKVTKLPEAPAPADAAQQPANGAALASSVAAIGIAVGMVGAALTGLLAVVAGMVWWQILVALAAVVAAVSLPSVLLAWFRLRQRDLGAILNASGWAINRPLRFSMCLARKFTVRA